MGQRRKHNPENLPDRVYKKHGAYYYVDREQKWHLLGKVWDKAARVKWAGVSTTGSVPNSVAALLDEYLRHCAERVKLGRLALRTKSDYETDATYLRTYFAGAQAHEVQRKDVATYLEDRGAPTRANREVALLSAAYNHAIKKFKLTDNPCFKVPRNEEAARDRYVEHWERRQFAKRCCPPWLRAYVLLKYLTGLRMGDLLRLSSANETGRGIRADIGKSRKRQVLEFRWTWALRTTVGSVHRLRVDRPAAKETLVGEQDHRDSVHPTTYWRVTSRGFKSAWQRAMKKWVEMGYERFREHDIRAKSGSDSRTVADAQALLGHTNSSTTSKHYRRGVTRVKPLR